MVWWCGVVVWWCGGVVILIVEEVDTDLTLLSSDHWQCCIHSTFLPAIKKINFLPSFPIPMFLYYFYTTKLFSFSVNIERITSIERVFKFQFSITSLLHRTYWFCERTRKKAILQTLSEICNVTTLRIQIYLLLIREGFKVENKKKVW